MKKNSILVKQVLMSIVTAGIISFSFAFTSCSDDDILENEVVPPEMGQEYDGPLQEPYGLSFYDFETTEDVTILNADTTQISVSKALADKSWRVEGVNLGNEPEHFNQTGFSALPTGFVHDYPLHAGGLWEHWKEHESAIYWCADFNSDYPKPAPVIDTANISPDPYPAWNYGWPDSIYPQPYIFKMNIHSDPSISSLADLHFCAVRCVKN